MESLHILLIALVVVAAFVWSIRPPAEFVVRVSGGKASAVRGKVTAGFLSLVESLCEEFGVRECEVRGVARRGRISLWPSPNVPPGLRQRLLNWWSVSGWAPAPRRRRG